MRCPCFLSCFEFRGKMWDWMRSCDARKWSEIGGRRIEGGVLGLIWVSRSHSCQGRAAAGGKSWLLLATLSKLLMDNHPLHLDNAQTNDYFRLWWSQHIPTGTQRNWWMLTDIIWQRFYSFPPLSLPLAISARNWSKKEKQMGKCCGCSRAQKTLF